MNDFDSEQNRISKLKQSLKIFKETYSNLKLYEINLKDLNQTLQKLLDDLTWLDFLELIDANLFTIQNNTIEAITKSLNQWKAAEISCAGSNAEQFFPIFQRQIKDCYKSLITILVYYRDCKLSKLSQISEQVYNSYNSYSFYCFVYKIKQSFVILKENLDQYFEIPLASLVSALEKHFYLFLPGNKISGLLISELQTNLAFGSEIGLNRLEELFFVLLGTKENFEAFQKRNFWYLKIEDKLIEWQKKVGNFNREEFCCVKFQIDVLGENMDRFKNLSLIFERRNFCGNEGFDRNQLVTIGSDSEFVNDVNLGNGWEVAAVIFVENSSTYILQISEFPIRIYAYPNTEIEINSKTEIKVGQFLTIHTRISSKKYLIVRIKLKDKPTERHSSSSQPDFNLSIGSDPSCHISISLEGTPSKFLEFYKRNSKFYFKSTGEHKVTYSPTQTGEAIHLKQDQIFYIEPFGFQIKHIN